MKTAVIVRFGANHTLNNRHGRPNRLSSGTGVMPWVSIARSDPPVGIRPP